MEQTIKKMEKLTTGNDAHDRMLMLDKYPIYMENKLPEMRMIYVIYLIDSSPDTRFVNQMIPVAYTESEHYAQMFTVFMNKQDCDDPNRTYKYTTVH